MTPQATRRLLYPTANATGMSNQPPSSIGLAWPPKFDAHNARMKGFYPGLIDRYEGAVGLSDALSIWADAIRSNPEVQRASMRIVCTYGILREWFGEESDITRHDLALRYSDYHAEAVIPLNMHFDGHATEENCLVYVGYNRQNRKSPIRVAVVNSLGKYNQEPVTPEYARTRVESARVRLTALETATPEEITRITDLFRASFQKYLFEINYENVGALLSDSLFTLVGRNDDGLIVSTLVAEHAQTSIAGRAIHIVELSEFATDSAYRGHGLITALQFMALDRLRELLPHQDTVVYAEARAPWIPVNISLKRAGFSNCGFIEQHCVLVGDRSPGMQYAGDYEDLVVWTHKL